MKPVPRFVEVRRHDPDEAKGDGPRLCLGNLISRLCHRWREGESPILLERLRRSASDELRAQTLRWGVDAVVTSRSFSKSSVRADNRRSVPASADVDGVADRALTRQKARYVMESTR